MIAHWITPGTCSDRKLRNYHKCFGCSFGHGGDGPQHLAPLPRVQTGTKTAPQPAAQAV